MPFKRIHRSTDDDRVLEAAHPPHARLRQSWPTVPIPASLYAWRRHPPHPPIVHPAFTRAIGVDILCGTDDGGKRPSGLFILVSESGALWLLLKSAWADDWALVSEVKKDHNKLT